MHALCVLIQESGCGVAQPFPTHAFEGPHSHVLVHQNRGENGCQGEVKCYGPIGIVVLHRDVASSGLNHQQNGCSVRVRFDGLRECTALSEKNIHEDGDGDDTHQHSMEPLNKNLEGGVSVIWAAGIRLFRVLLPVFSLLFFADHKMPCAKTCWPFRARFSSIVDADAAAYGDDEKRHHNQHEREGRGATPPRLFHGTW